MSLPLRTSGLLRPVASGLTALLVILAAATAARAQTTWEYSPYQIRVWVALGPAAELTPRLQEQIARTLVEQSELVVGAAWDVQAESPPARLHHQMVTALESVTAGHVEGFRPEALEGDKLFLVSIDEQAESFRVQARELDCRTRLLGPLIERRVRQPETLARHVLAATLATFAPLARVEDSKGNTAVLRLRAGGLVVEEDSPVLQNTGHILRPVLRRNDRLGQLRPGGVQALAWTYLQVTERNGSLLQCRVHSGMRSPLGGRSGPRTQRLALGVQPPGDVTRLRLQTAASTPQPLPGYEVIVKDPVTERSEVLGHSNWQGLIEVPRGDVPLVVVYIRNGGRLLARLPLVPGLEAELQAPLNNDDRRLQAEAFVQGLQTAVMDVVARREILASRFRKRLAEKDLDSAQRLLEELRTLDTRTELLRQLNQQQQRLSSSDVRLQSKIDKLFGDTRAMMIRHLDNRLASQLSNELQQASAAQ